ncbi:MAG: excinuclease ABC subunit UvrA [Planctomycetales bacterium]|nr:excinuclease ABC subunit UvrA [Planctomycetales bacterium]
MRGQIELRGVEVHNLKKVDLDLPRHKLIVFCGVSGSGKTSLALDTLYAEGQRRYIESFSVYTRQFLERLEKPAAERIDGLPAALAVTHDHSARSPRSTIGTTTETADYLRLLYARIGKLYCRNCGRLVEKDSPESVAERLSQLPTGTKFQIAFPRKWAADLPFSAISAPLREAGFVRAIVGGETVDLTNPGAEGASRRGAEDAEVLVIVDRLLAGQSQVQRVRDSIETAFAHGDGVCVVLLEASEGQERRSHSNSRRCLPCNIDYPDPEPRQFSFNSPLGACPKCEGAGTLVADGPTKRKKLTLVCDACNGRRLNENALAWRVGGKNIAELMELRIDELRPFLQSLPLSATEQTVAKTILEQLDSRLKFLLSLGLGYLALSRPLSTLSGGEAQRVNLTSALGSSLVNMLYVLDEPSVGLHPGDVDKLVAAVRGLKNRGNTVAVVEHEESLIRAADHIVEIGPGAGESGGTVAFQGTPTEMLVPGASLTGEYLAGRRGIVSTATRKPITRGRIKLTGARGHNLKNLSLDFPLGVLCLVTGVSGAGKSSLVQETLYGALCRRKKKDCDEPLPYDDVFGDGQIDDVVLMDQSPIGRSPRSNPVTYIKAFDQIRQVFAETVEARTHNYGPGHFSFNVEGGRCDACEGDGYKQIDMQFLPDVLVKCKVCGGTRYRREILAVTYRGKSIAEVLEMTAREAFSFFRGQPKVQGRLKQLMDVGLDYLRLGQPAPTLSTGEAQRLKLAAYLSEASRSRTLFLLDEPTTGLHFADIVKLLDCFDALLSVGHSLIIVEHNLQLMRSADYLIDLGPGAGDDGGRIVVQGTPEEVAACEESVTGRFLRGKVG